MLKSCPECGSKIGSRAAACPGCGSVMKRDTALKLVMLTGGLIALVSGVMWRHYMALDPPMYVDAITPKLSFFGGCILWAVGFLVRWFRRD